MLVLALLVMGQGSFFWEHQRELVAKTKFRKWQHLFYMVGISFSLTSISHTSLKNTLFLSYGTFLAVLYCLILWHNRAEPTLNIRKELTILLAGLLFFVICGLVSMCLQ